MENGVPEIPSKFNLVKKKSFWYPKRETSFHKKKIFTLTNHLEYRKNKQFLLIINFHTSLETLQIINHETIS